MQMCTDIDTRVHVFGTSPRANNVTLVLPLAFNLHVHAQRQTHIADSTWYYAAQH